MRRESSPYNLRRELSQRPPAPELPSRILAHGDTQTTDSPSLPFAELTARLASREPIPGGGSAAALAGAMGAALVAMVAELTIGRPDARAHEQTLCASCATSAVAHRDLLQRLAEQDAVAYDGGGHGATPPEGNR